MKLVLNIFKLFILLNASLIFAMDKSLDESSLKDLLTGFKFYLKHDNLLLFKAIKDQDEKAVEALVNLGANVNATESVELHYHKVSATPLQEAIRYKNQKIIKTLINAGADIKCLLKSSDVNILIASPEILEFIIKKTNVDLEFIENIIPLLFKQTFFNEKLFQILLKYIDINHITKSGNTLLNEYLKIYQDKINKRQPYREGRIDESDSYQTGLGLAKIIKLNTNLFINDQNKLLFKFLNDNKKLYGGTRKICNALYKNIINCIKNNDFENFKKYIIETSINIKHKDRDNNKNNLLHGAIEANNIPAIFLIFSLCPELMFEKNTDNKTPWDLLKESGILVSQFIPKFLEFENQKSLNEKKRKLEENN